MTSSSACFVFVSLLFLLGSASASTKYINTVCKTVPTKQFCLKTLNAYPPAVSAPDLVTLRRIAIRLGLSNAKKTARFIVTLKNDPKYKLQFNLCHGLYYDIMLSFQKAIKEFVTNPFNANYTMMSCFENTDTVKALIGTNKDKASKEIIKMTLLMEKFIDIAVAATTAFRLNY